MKYVVASDHAGVDLKAALVAHLRGLGADVEDLGPEGRDSVDYPDFAARAAGAVVGGQAERAVLICGTGIGMCIAANKVDGVRAAVVSEPFSAALAVEHNDAQVLCVGARVVGEGLAKAIVDAYHGARYQGGRHQRRLDKLSALERGGR